MAVIELERPVARPAPAPPVEAAHSAPLLSDDVPTRLPLRNRRAALRLTAAAALATGLVAVVLPRLMGVTWPQIGEALLDLSWWHVAGLTALWAAGLVVHTVALAAAMPGLTRRRALLLNLTGSFVSNLVPLGGAAGTVANYSMSRSWGFSRAAFVRWAAVTNVWDTLLKLVLPGIALGWLAWSGIGVEGFRDAALLGGAAFVAFGGVVVGLVAFPSWTRALGRLLTRLTHNRRYAAHLTSLRADTASLITRTWGRLTVGKVAYAVLQAALCWACLAAVGLSLDPAVVFAAFAAERILSMLVLTPGAAGFVEVGMAGALVALGADPVGAAAGILLYRFFTFAMEIPVGGAGMVWWLHHRGRAEGALA